MSKSNPICPDCLQRKLIKRELSGGDPYICDGYGGCEGRFTSNYIGHMRNVTERLLGLIEGTGPKLKIEQAPTGDSIFVEGQRSVKLTEES